MSQIASFHGSFYARLQNVAFQKQQDHLTFEKQQEKNKNIICLGLEHGPRPAASGRTQDLWHSFSQYGPPGRQIIYISRKVRKVQDTAGYQKNASDQEK